MRSAVVAAVVMCAVPAIAADHPCEADAQKFCAGVQPGQGRILQCLKQHEADLSPECKQRRDSFRERMEEIRAACEADAKKFCSDIRPGSGRIAACLKSHENELSDACRNEGEKMRARGEAHRALIQDVQQACRDDANKFCSGIRPGGGRIAACLKSHQSELSQPCTAAVKDAKDRW
ncbi:MAG TPA: cysteine rich repeat-containing protein [Myxococcales bacterium]|nr:cysteine rich repeat-containing protein [Myxococcales bacterium]